MQPTLMATKVRIPPQPHHAVQRKQLVDALERGTPHHKLTTITAPAGYGKTSLLLQWAHSSQYRIAWLSIDRNENDLERFLRYLLRSWEVVQPDIQESELDVLLGAQSPDGEAVLSAFINVAAGISDDTIFVLDDYHLIGEQSIHNALTFLLDHLPPQLHFVLAGRGEPRLPLARYRAHHALLEFGTEELQFSTKETAAFLRQVMELNVTDDEIDGLQNQLEGWIAGLYLAVIALRHDGKVPDRIISGKHHFIADYLREDVLAYLSDKVIDFLLKTSILDRFCESLCDAVTGRDDSQEMLAFLERENLFLIPLDDSRQWFRYHGLFADFLQEELHQWYRDDAIDIQRHAAHWYLAHDLPDQAFRHAVEGKDVELLVQIVDRYLNAKVVSGEIKVVKQWVDLLPDGWLSRQPILGLARAGFLAATGAFEDCIRWLDVIEKRLSPDEDSVSRQQFAKVTAVRCYVACFQNNLAQAETYADKALRDLPEEDLGGFRGGAYVALGDTYRRNGHWEEAKQSYLNVLNVSYSTPFRFGAAHIYGALADLELRQGHLRNAESYWRNALESIQDRETWGHLPLPVTGWVYIRMGELLYERNLLDKTWDHLTRGLKRAELGGDVRAMIAGYLIAGRLKLTQGDIEAAAAYLEQARPLVESAQFAHWQSRFERFQLEVWLTQDRLRAAVDWSDKMLRDSAIAQRPESEVAQLAMARVLIVKGDMPALNASIVPDRAPARRCRGARAYRGFDRSASATGASSMAARWLVRRDGFAGTRAAIG